MDCKNDDQLIRYVWGVGRRMNWTKNRSMRQLLYRKAIQWNGWQDELLSANGRKNILMIHSILHGSGWWARRRGSIKWLQSHSDVFWYTQVFISDGLSEVPQAEHQVFWYSYSIGESQSMESLEIEELNPIPRDIQNEIVKRSIIDLETDGSRQLDLTENPAHLQVLAAIRCFWNVLWIACSVRKSGRSDSSMTEAFHRIATD